MSKLLRWLTILSLDAPLVTFAWQRLFAHMEGVQLHWSRSAIVVAAVWLGYAGDRWLDSTQSNRILGERHHWYRKSKWRVFLFWLLILLTTITLSFWYLETHELIRGFVLTAASLLYTLFAQKGRRLPLYGHMKCLFISLLIASSAALFATKTGPVPIIATPSFLLIVATFYINCQYIRLWDDRPGSRASTILILSMTLLAISVLVGIIYPKASVACASISLSLGGLWVIDFQQPKLSPETVRSIADIALLSPFIAMVFA